MHDGVTIKRDSPGSGGDPEASFRLLAETIPEIVFSVTPDGHCDFVNARWTEYTGLPREQAMEYGWLAALHPDDAGACRGRWQAALGRAESVEMECRFRRDDGQHRWFLVRAEPLRGDDGRPERWLGTCTDIDARRRAEADAQESEERYRALASATSDAIFLHESGTVLDVNEAFTEDFGYEPAEASGTDAVGLLAAPESRDDLRRRICSDSSGPHEAVLRRKDGSTFVAEVRCGTIRHRGRPVRVASVRDITERKRAEEAIRRSEARQRFLLGLHERLRPLDDPGAIQYEAARAVGEHLGAHRVGYGEVPEDGETIVIARNYTNGVPDIEGTYRFDDYGPDLLRNFRLGRTFVRTDIARDPSLSEAERAALGALHLGATADVPLLKDGRLVAVLFTHHREPRGWTGEELTLLEAVAELTWNAVVRARAEAALKRSEGRFRAAVDAVSGILWTNNARGEMEGEQPGWSALTGQSYEDYQGFGWSRAVHPEDARPTIDAWGRAVAERRTFVFEHRVRRHDGAWRRFAIRAIPVLREDGEVAEWVGVHTDVTEQRETEEALRRGEAEMRAVFQALTEGVVFLDTEGQVQAANEAVERTFGHSPQELRDPELDPRFRMIRPDGSPFPVDEQPAVVALRTGRPVRDVEMGVRERDGRLSWRSVNAQPVHDDDGRLIGTVASFFDITERKRAEAERGRIAAESERLRLMYEAALSNTPDLVYIFNLDHRFIYANEALLRMWGRSREDAIGKNCLELGYEPWHAAMHDREIEEVVATRRPIRGEVPFTGTNGRRIYDYIFVPVLGQDGGVVAVAGTTRDVTERQRAEAELRASEERFRAFMNNSPAPAWITDDEGRIVYLSDTYRKTFLLPPGEVIGRTVFEIYPEEIARTYLENIRAAAAAGGPVESLELGPRGDGSEGLFLVYKFPLADAGGRTLVGGVAVDITERQRAEEALRENDRRKDEFLAMLAHELRNPLSAVSNAAAILESSGDPDAGKWAVEVLSRQTRQLARLIDDLMDVSRISRGKLQLRQERIDAAPVLRRAMQAARAAIAAKGHELLAALPEGPAWVDADPARLEQMVLNLLFNAAKYTEEGGSIRLEAGRDGGDIRVSVEDNGIGIAPEMLPRIFEPFVQVDASLARSQGGLGIGLTLVRTLAEMHGGRITASSPGPGQGSEFVLRLPAAGPPPGAERPAAAHPQPSQGLRILAVDDNLDLVTSMARLLRRAGHEVRTVTDGLSALAEARSYRPDVILLDIGLPGMDGYQVAAELKQDPSLAATTMIALSGYSQPEDRRRTSQAGFDHHLAKPVEAHELTRLLGRIRSPSL